jgi:hypothetical protein
MIQKNKVIQSYKMIQNTKKMYRIEWRSKNTNYRGHGDWFESKSCIKAWIDHLNYEYKRDIDHWLVERE